MEYCDTYNIRVQIKSDTNNQVNHYGYSSVGSHNISKHLDRYIVTKCAYTDHNQVSC